MIIKKAINELITWSIDPLLRRLYEYVPNYLFRTVNKKLRHKKKNN